MSQPIKVIVVAAVLVLLVPAAGLAAPRYLFPHAEGGPLGPQLAPADQDSEYIYYDDSIPQYYWALSGGDRAAVRFTTPAPTDLDSAEVLSIQVMLYDATGPGNIVLHLWEDDDGLPGEDLITPMEVTPTQYATPTEYVWNSFVDVRFHDTPNPDYQEVERDIWIGYELLTGAPNPLGDITGDTDRSYFYEGSAWVPVNDSDLMIRIWWGQDVPVELSVFTYQVVENGLLIQWETQSETENFGFRLLRSSQLTGPYAPVSEVIPGAGTTIVPQRYEFLDTEVEWGHAYYYFLEDIDLSGQSHRSGPLAASFGIAVIPPVASLPCLEVWPNPMNEAVDLRFIVPAVQGSELENGRGQFVSPQDVTLAMFDVNGRITRWLYKGQALPGTYFVRWDGATDSGRHTAPGVYFCRLDVGGRADVVRVIRTP